MFLGCNLSAILPAFLLQKSLTDIVIVHIHTTWVQGLELRVESLWFREIGWKVPRMEGSSDRYQLLHALRHQPKP